MLLLFLQNISKDISKNLKPTLENNISKISCIISVEFSTFTAKYTKADKRNCSNTASAAKSFEKMKSTHIFKKGNMPPKSKSAFIVF